MITPSKYFFFIAVLAIGSLSAQYSARDRNLVEAGFNRDGSHSVFIEYLKSKDEQKIKAVLLGLANLNDSTFHDEIVSLDFVKYGKYISFALSCNNPSVISLDFLREKAKTVQGTTSKDVFDALGKIGDSTDLKWITELNAANDAWKAEGVSMAIANFALRGIKSPQSQPALLKILTKRSLDNKTKFLAAYALLRTRPTPEMVDDLKNQLSDVLSGGVFEEEYDLMKYLLLNLRFLKVSPYSPSEVKNMLPGLPYTVQIDLVSTLQFFKVEKEKELDALLELTGNSNENISSSVASMLKLMVIEPLVIDSKIDSFEKALFNHKPGSSTFHELALSIFAILPQKRDNLISNKEISENVRLQISLISEYPELVNSPFDDLTSIYFENPERIKLPVVEALAKLYKKELEREKILAFGFEQLKSGYPSVVSTICEIFDSVYIVTNKEKLSNQILIVVNEELNNSQFLEAHQSLLKLAGLITPEFAQEIKSIFVNSAVSSIRALSGEKPQKNSSTIFELIWNNAFKYKKAVFETDKGSFTLQLFPEYAPVSVGNFSTLAQAGFYRDVIFHRVVPGFVIQAGDPTGTGWGGPGYDIIPEYSPLEYSTGALGMASAGKDTEGSQFFVMQGSFPHLTSRYTLFGRITDGQSVVDLIPQFSIIKKISLFE
ncbi:hypothetical protein MASR2M39_16740 [Ignavibacteriales bacterium]